IAFNQETKPKIKNNSPMMRIEINVCRLLIALASIVAVLLIISLLYRPTGQLNLYQDKSYSFYAPVKYLPGKDYLQFFPKCFLQLSLSGYQVQSKQCSLIA